MITVKIIDREHKGDINISNESFKLFGRMIPSYINEKWSYEVELLPDAEITEMCFPDENYDYDSMCKDHVFIGAYAGDKCVGLAILRHQWHKYMYLYDLKVNAEYRGKGVGTMLLEEAKKVAPEQGYIGVYTQGQDNNLAACLFYINSGFTIGGLDTNVYKGTKQENKKDIIFYYDAV